MNIITADGQRPESRELYDAVIVGGGPAGLSAAIYMARAKYRVLVMEKGEIGGQIRITDEVVNYPGVGRTDGKNLTDTMKKQAEAFGAEFASGEVLSVDAAGDIKALHTTRGDINTLGVILATGANPRKLGFKGEKEFQGRGVAYCATCDGEFFTGKDVFVIGGGFAAAEESIFLTKYARSVHIIVRGDAFTCAKSVSDELAKYEKIKVSFNTEIEEVSGDGTVSRACFRNNKTGETWSYELPDGEPFGVFVFAGYEPNTAWLGDTVKTDESGYIITDINRKTNRNGIYAAGDVCIKNLRQVVTAVSDGATAATSLEKYVSGLHEKFGIPELIKENKADARGKGGNSLDLDVSHSEPDPGTDSEKSSGKYTEQDIGTEGAFISPDIRKALEPVFAKFERKVRIRLRTDEFTLSAEVKSFIRELSDLSDKLIYEGERPYDPEDEDELLPSIELLYEDGSDSGIRFHGVPGGHEFNSFIIALYNTAGPGQSLDKDAEEKIKAIESDINIKVFVSLSCTMCPETVMAAQKAAAVSPHITAEMVDIMRYEKIKKKYNIMSVPCTVINNSELYFGKKSFTELAGILEAYDQMKKSSKIRQNTRN